MLNENQFWLTKLDVEFFSEMFLSTVIGWKSKKVFLKHSESTSTRRSYKKCMNLYIVRRIWILDYLLPLQSVFSYLWKAFFLNRVSCRSIPR